MKPCHGKTIEADYRIQFGAPRLVRTGNRISTLVTRLFACGPDELKNAFDVTESEKWLIHNYLQKLLDRDGETDLAEAFWEGRRSVQEGGER